MYSSNRYTKAVRYRGRDGCAHYSICQSCIFKDAILDQWQSSDQMTVSPNNINYFQLVNYYAVAELFQKAELHLGMESCILEHSKSFARALRPAQKKHILCSFFDMHQPPNLPRGRPNKHHRTSPNQLAVSAAAADPPAAPTQSHHLCTEVSCKKCCNNPLIEIGAPAAPNPAIH